MKILRGNLEGKLMALKPYLPYGVLEPWDDLNPKLYHSIHIYWLKFYGMWYNNHSPKSIFFWGQIVYTTIVLWLVCFLPCIGEVVYLLRRKENIGDIAEGLYLFLSEMYTYFKIAVFWLNKDKILHLLQYLHCDEFKADHKEHRDILKRSIKKARFIMTYYAAICVGAVSVGIVMPFTENFDVLPTNVEYPFIDVNKPPAYSIIYLHHTNNDNKKTERLYGRTFIYYRERFFLLLGSWLMNRKICKTETFKESVNDGDRTYWNGNHHALYKQYVTFMEEIYYKPATCIIDAVMDTILAAFIAAAIGQIEILGHNLRNFDILAEEIRERTDVAVEKSEPTDFYVRLVLKKCVIHYNAIIRYVSMIEAAFSLASALQFMLSVMVLCLIGIQFLSIENPISHPMQITWMAIYLTCMLIEVFIQCWFGNELILKSSELRHAAFGGPWLKTDPKTTIMIIIFLERCQRPLRVTAGKIFTLSLDTYTNLINWAYKAFAVMRNMKK